MAVVSSIPRGFSGPACSFSLAEPVRGTAPFRGRPAEFAPKSLGPSQRSIGVRSQGEAPPSGAATITVQGDAPAGDSWQALARRPPFDLPPSMGGGSLPAGRRGFDVTSPTVNALLVRLQAGTIFPGEEIAEDRKSTRLNSSHPVISYAVFCLK